MGKIKDYIDNDEASPTAAELYLNELKRLQVVFLQMAKGIDEVIENIGGSNEIQSR